MTFEIPRKQWIVSDLVAFNCTASIETAYRIQDNSINQQLINTFVKYVS